MKRAKKHNPVIGQRVPTKAQLKYQDRVENTLILAQIVLGQIMDIQKAANKNES